jgi:peptidyl-tRNA hydrolase, PTH1 family
VVGLANPEAEYGGTRHNIGADMVRRFAERLGWALKPHKKAQGLLADGRIDSVPLSLMVPFGYMNTSGGPVQAAMAFYKVPHDRLIVAHDDLDLHVATLRLKHGGGTAGHKGLHDIQRRTGSPDFYRIRIGIGRPPGRQDPADYVLKRFPAKDREAVDVTVEQACDALLDLVVHGLEYAQNRHH